MDYFFAVNLDFFYMEDIGPIQLYLVHYFQLLWHHFLIVSSLSHPTFATNSSSHTWTLDFCTLKRFLFHYLSSFKVIVLIFFLSLIISLY